MSSRVASSACSRPPSPNVAELGLYAVFSDAHAGRTWGIAIVAGLAVAAALLVLPRSLLFEPQGRDACEDRGASYVGLASAPGRYGDPIPDGARCLLPGDPSPVELEVDFLGGAFGAWLYRLACIILPLAAALAIGSRLGRPRGARGEST